MPRYDYHCSANDCVIELSHGMAETVSTWGELCERAGIPLGDVSADAPVERAINREVSIASGSSSTRTEPTGGGCCNPGGCGCH